MVESNRRNEITLGGEANTSSFDDSEDDFESPAMGSGNVLEKVTMCVRVCVYEHVCHCVWAYWANMHR